MSTTTVVRIKPQSASVEAPRPAVVAVVRDEPMEYSAPRLPPRWLLVGGGVLGAGVLVELLVALVVIV